MNTQHGYHSIDPEFIRRMLQTLFRWAAAIGLAALLLVAFWQFTVWANGGRTVDIGHIQKVAARFGQTATWPDDSDGDGLITVYDIQWWASLWKRLPPVSEEPVVGWATGSEGILLRWRWPHLLEKLHKDLCRRVRGSLRSPARAGGAGKSVVVRDDNPAR